MNSVTHFFVTRHRFMRHTVHNSAYLWTGCLYSDGEEKSSVVLSMKGMVVYDTSYGNTKVIGETIAQTLKDSGVETDLFHVKDAKKLSPRDYDFIVLGSPTRFGTMSRTVKSFLGRMKSEEWMNKPFAAFDTELPDNVQHKEWSAAEKIATKLLEKKMIELSPVMTAIVLGNKGPLKEGEIDRTKTFATELATKLKANLAA